MTFIRTHWRKILIVLAGIVAIPILALNHMVERKAKEIAEETYRIDDKISDLNLVVNRDETVVVYQNGTKFPVDAFGMAVITEADYTANPGVLGDVKFAVDNFPVLAFFNATGFDTTGSPVVVRRISNGHLLHSSVRLSTKKPRVALSLRNGDFRVYYWESSTTKGYVTYDQQEWLATYMNLPPVKKSTDDLPPKTKEEAKLRAEKNSGIRGSVIRVGDAKNPIIPLKVPIHVFKDGTKFDVTKGPPKYDSSDDRIVVSLMSDDKGQYAVDLPPGKYIVTVEIDGVLYGNALRPQTFPSVRVPENTWIDYDIRRS